MKKIIGLSFISVLMVVVLVAAGCKGNTPVAATSESASWSSVDDTQPVVIEPPVVEPVASEPEPVITSEPVFEPEEDPMDMLKVDDSYMKQYGGRALKKDGALYILEKKVYGFNAKKYPGIGSKMSFDGARHLYEILTDVGRIVIGPVPTLTYDKGKDEIIYYSQNDFLESLKLQKADFYGYCLNADITNELNNHVVIYNHGDEGEEAYYHKDGVHDCGITDMDGNEVGDWYNLQKDQEYVLYWYIGTQYSEKKMVADSLAYSTEMQELTYEIEPELTKEGYVSYNLSEVEPGLYFLVDGALIEVK